MLNYFNKKKIQKALHEGYKEIVLYEPLYRTLIPYEPWCIEQQNFVMEHKRLKKEVEEAYISEVFKEISSKVAVVRDIIDHYGSGVDTEFFEEIMDDMERRIAADRKDEVFLVLLFYSELFARAERYLILKERIAELENNKL